MPPVNLGIPSAGPGPVGVFDRPDIPDLLDRYGRIARDLRVSITEKCSLRCTYCMPAEGLPAIAQERLLSADEIVRLVGIAGNDLGVREVRFTGGEPLMRRDLEEIIAGCTVAAPDVSLAITSNAVGLEHRAERLVAAGLSRINVSLDTIDAEHFARLTRRDRLDSVLAGIRAAKAAGLDRIKINAVLMQETLDEAPDLLRWCIDEHLELRFIEQMPLDADQSWSRTGMVSARRLLEVLGTRFTLTETERDDPSAPAERWLVDGGPATVGIIASVSRSFCSDCDRTRLTAEGTVRSCLFSDDETDLRSLLRNSASDEQIAAMWRETMWNKWAGHGINTSDFVRPLRSMGAIGG